MQMRSILWQRIHEEELGDESLFRQVMSSDDDDIPF